MRVTVDSPDGITVERTGGEHDLLYCLVTRPQRVLSREQLLGWTRGREAMPFDRTIDVQLGRLRRKLAVHPDSEALIKTVRGSGYPCCYETTMSTKYHWNDEPLLNRSSRPFCAMTSDFQITR